jgi:hypothetical protein
MAEKSGPQVPKRGEAAWKAVKEGVAERNEAASKAAKLERKAHIENADKLRRAAGAKRAEGLEARSNPHA